MWSLPTTKCDDHCPNGKVFVENHICVTVDPLGYPLAIKNGWLEIETSIWFGDFPASHISLLQGTHLLKLAAECVDPTGVVDDWMWFKEILGENLGFYKDR
jgi:hypothetical protein